MDMNNIPIANGSSGHTENSLGSFGQPQPHQLPPPALSTGQQAESPVHQPSITSTLNLPESYSANSSSSNGGQNDPNIKITMENKAMWDKFSGLDTEMILTKGGRRMFPPISCKNKGFKSNSYV